MSTTAVRRPLVEIFAEAVFAGDSGIVTATRGKLKRLFCIERGRLVYAQSNVIEEQFEQRLVDRAVLEPQELERARALAGESGLPVAAWLAEQEQPGQAVLLVAMSEHVQGLLDDTLAWKGGSFAYAKGRPDLRGQPVTDLSLADVVLARGREYPKRLEDVRLRLGSPGTRFTRTKRIERILEGSRPDPVVAYLIERTERATPLGSLIENTPHAEEATLRTLLSLTALGAMRSSAISREGAEAHRPVTREECEARVAQAEQANHYMVLGIGASANIDEVRQAYYVLARRFHPDRFRAGPLQDLLPRIEGYFAKVTEAYNTLSDAETRSDYDEMIAGNRPSDEEPKKDSAYLAKENYVRAKLLIDRRQFNEAVQFLENALELDTKPLYLWTLGELISRNPRQRAEAEEHISKAIALDPTAADAHVALGRVMARGGREAEAREAFEKALHWEPRHPGALAGLEALGDGKKDKKGVFGGLFGKS